ncbi:S46 family peptidase [Ideonella sp. 4Y16]|uniref:Dipeptidyl-peptidase n=1 Tax=Ideonella alba TaxID=2824118 RepID=A0A941BLF1_9BURK|nr:S46 family peptidase [Ideonella alba]MBQ0931129.1 S46 family peptidase [Ideonella alba]MBQ0944279.1 S46 family peptidase [Ideonella alba]
MRPACRGRASRAARAGRARALAALLVLLPWAAGTVRGAEGLWPWEQVPADALQQSLGVRPSPALLARLQAATVSLDGSGAVVSAAGLVLTNYHVVQECIAALSGPRRDLARSGFTAARMSDERRCPGLVVRQWVHTQDLGAELQRALAAAGPGDDPQRVRAAELTRLEAACQQAHPDEVCELATLYAGARTVLRRYRVWDDVRLVWAPEAAAALFGGDADNLTYPRFALDAALLRVRDRHGRPPAGLRPLALATRPLREDEPLFVAGFPASTERLRTQAQLEMARDVTLSRAVADTRQRLDEMQRQLAASPDLQRASRSLVYDLENAAKQQALEAQALHQPGLLAGRAQVEQRLRAAWSRSGRPGDPWADIAQATALQRELAPQTEAMALGGSTLFARATTLVALASEAVRPELQRLPDYRASTRPAHERALRDESAIDLVRERADLTQALQEALARLGPGHAFVQAALAGRPPAQAAEALVAGSRLAESATRRRLLDGGLPALMASTDPLLALARDTWGVRRELLWRQAQEVDAVIERATRAIGEVAALPELALAPDADGSLRLSAGRARGVVTGGRRLPWTTTWGGWWDRADSFDQAEPFRLPPRLQRARARLDPRARLCLALDADVAPGHSGSPVVNAQGELVGLLFDGNGGSLGYAWGFDANQARGVALHAQALQVALSQVYPGRHLLREMGWPATAASTKIQPAPRARHPREKR